MAYIKYKEITKYFNFIRVLDKDKLPNFISEYVFKDEKILAAYKTSTDHGIFTTKKILLFDNYSLFGRTKHIHTIPYKSISSLSVMFLPSRADLILYMDSGYPVRIKFINMKSIDKLRLRLIYSVIMQVVNDQKVDADVVDKLVNDNLSFE